MLSILETVLFDVLSTDLLGCFVNNSPLGRFVVFVNSLVCVVNSPLGCVVKSLVGCVVNSPVGCVVKSCCVCRE